MSLSACGIRVMFSHRISIESIIFASLFLEEIVETCYMILKCLLELTNEDL